jgi:hypothetical protein
MIPPFPLYVDEISPDKIKATVSNTGTVSYNLRMMLLDMPFPARNPFHDPSYQNSVADRIGKEIKGICIWPIGRFLCMLVRNESQISALFLDFRSMIFLDLIDKEDLAEKMAEKLSHVDLRERFMQVYTEIVSHPEKHKRFKLVVGPPPPSV